MLKTSLGTHITWDVYNCNAESLSFIPKVQKVLNAIVKELQLSKVNESFKQFEPVGVTGFILLEESHVSIHTWPEHQFAAIDIFSCQPFNAEIIQNLLMESFSSNNVIIKQIERGEAIGNSTPKVL
ncbi:adenosylmethionine decarboxylase [Winogradskyella eckloniae]|uniref:adenosylmethionine decarboxylase n=1 Tax=Winogradskyella eckloniae TaxID=1089306 RepID=UPI0015651D8C|nr:adenosylmethionine decarboxylase [Winogradskyella eckloniae]NRD20309.1 adenosylmethionine decarboxylase [Winogradskyella eckloniae]